ncbi:lachesin-like [Vespula squamosa]|uniref:Lachesin-like n=1 Tax=Vespula squamosa TaxID=30214 RepID=A0ABD1ZVA9_VESSQ
MVEVTTRFAMTYAVDKGDAGTTPTRVCGNFCDDKKLARVEVPRVEIVDERGATTGDKFYKAGSTIELKCVVSNIPQPTGYVTWRHGSRALNYDTTRGGISSSYSSRNLRSYVGMSRIETTKLSSVTREIVEDVTRS